MRWRWWGWVWDDKRPPWYQFAILSVWVWYKLGKAEFTADLGSAGACRWYPLWFMLTDRLQFGDFFNGAQVGIYSQMTAHHRLIFYGPPYRWSSIRSSRPPKVKSHPHPSRIILTFTPSKMAQTKWDSSTSASWIRRCRSGTFFIPFGTDVASQYYLSFWFTDS